MRPTTLFATAAVLVLASLSAFAEPTAPLAIDPPPAISLGVDSGNVLISTGGEFVAAAPGQTLAPGHRVLVPEGASARLEYGNGCQKALSTAGVYTVAGDCVAGGDAARSGPSAATITGVAVGVGAAAAAAGGGGSDPISR